MARPMVVVIDPDEGVRDGLRALIGTLGADVVVFASAEGFLTSIDESAPPACVISEFDLPGMSGMDLLWHLHEEGPPTAVIMLATCADVSTAVRCMHLGAAHFMEKPLAGPDLLRRVSRVLNAAAPATVSGEAVPTQTRERP